LNLLTEETYVDSLLTNLPVCSMVLFNIFFMPSFKIFQVYAILESQFLVLSLIYYKICRFYQRRSKMPLQQLQPIQLDYMVRASTLQAMA
jgi:hypothetical protein